MNMKQHFSIVALLATGIFTTGCSQQQVQEAPASTPAKAPVAVVTPAAPTNPDCHNHPRNAATNSITHCHKNPQGKHNYGSKPATAGVDVSKLQAKLKAKGYYKGPIDGVINTETRSALKKFQNR